MKREIKFRGLRTDGKGWVYGYYAKHKTRDIIVNDVFNDGGYDFVFNEVLLESIGQFTGLTDKNGIEIYEGDVCDYDDNDSMSMWTRGERFVVVANKGRFSARMKPFTKYDGCNQNTLTEEFEDCINAIGNIYKNPELLKKQKNEQST